LFSKQFQSIVKSYLYRIICIRFVNGYRLETKNSVVKLKSRKPSADSKIKELDLGKWEGWRVRFGVIGPWYYFMEFSNLIVKKVEKYFWHLPIFSRALQIYQNIIVRYLSSELHFSKITHSYNIYYLSSRKVKWETHRRHE
jgi:hypothetical protein